jgi:hypothetical protein
MSLDNINISPYLVKELYGDFLINDSVMLAENKEVGTEENVIKFLGKNEKNILVVVAEKDHVFLTEEELAFLMNVLNACAVTIQDSALVNCSSRDEKMYDKLMLQFTPEYIIFAGAKPSSLGFPIEINNYRVQKYNNVNYLCSPALQKISADKEEKKLLWNALKTLFSIG